MIKNKLYILVFIIFTISVSCGKDSEIVKDSVDKVIEDEVPEETDDTDEMEDSNVVSESVVATYGQLSVQGNKIVDKNSNPIQLRGMSLFWSQWMGQFYTKEAVTWLKDDWQATVVRAAIGVDEGTDGYIYKPEIEKEKVFKVIDGAIESGVYVIVDWHSHHAEDYLAEAKVFFAEVAQKYGDKPNIIYEIYNEPLDVSWDNVLKPYHEAVLSEIRKYDSDNIVICGTRTWSQRVDEVIGNTINDENIAYTLHYYSSTHKQELRNIAKQAIDADIALFVTEFGVTEASGNGTINTAEAILWWNFLDQHKISWCNWSIADKEEASAALLPGASGAGGWNENQLTTSGTMVRDEMKEKNQDFK